MALYVPMYMYVRCCVHPVVCAGAMHSSGGGGEAELPEPPVPYYAVYSACASMVCWLVWLCTWEGHAAVSTTSQLTVVV